MSVICIENLVRDYGGGKGIFDISFHVSQGEAFGFLDQTEPRFIDNFA